VDNFIARRTAPGWRDAAPCGAPDAAIKAACEGAVGMPRGKGVTGLAAKK
jgi:hypothetical protein